MRFWPLVSLLGGFGSSILFRNRGGRIYFDIDCKNPRILSGCFAKLFALDSLDYQDFNMGLTAT